MSAAEDSCPFRRLHLHLLVLGHAGEWIQWDAPWEEDGDILIPKGELEYHVRFAALFERDAPSVRAIHRESGQEESFHVSVLGSEVHV